MQKSERGYKHIIQGAKEKARNLVPIRAYSLKELVQLVERERVNSIRVKSDLHTIYRSVGEIGWGEFPISTSNIPDAYLPKTSYEARGLGRRIVMSEIHPELDRESTTSEARFRCGLTEEHRQKKLAKKLPHLRVDAESELENEEDYRWRLRMARRMGLDPYELKQEDKEFFGEGVLPS